jgi:hypothetical protein
MRMIGIGKLKVKVKRRVKGTTYTPLYSYLSINLSSITAFTISTQLTQFVKRKKIMIWIEDVLLAYVDRN